MQSDLRSDEDMSFMTHSELQFFHRTKPHEKHPQLERKCMSVSVEGNGFSEEVAFQHWAVIPVYVSGSSFGFNLRKLNCIHNTWMAFCASSVSSIPIKAAELPTRTAGEALHTLINKTTGHYWYLSTAYASNGLENWLSLICINIKLSL